MRNTRNKKRKDKRMSLGRWGALGILLLLICTTVFGSGFNPTLEAASGWMVMGLMAIVCTMTIFWIGDKVGFGQTVVIIICLVLICVTILQYGGVLGSVGKWFLLWGFLLIPTGFILVPIRKPKRQRRAKSPAKATD